MNEYIFRKNEYEFCCKTLSKDAEATHVRVFVKLLSSQERIYKRHLFSKLECLEKSIQEFSEEFCAGKCYFNRSARERHILNLYRKKNEVFERLYLDFFRLKDDDTLKDDEILAKAIFSIKNRTEEDALALSRALISLNESERIAFYDRKNYPADIQESEFTLVIAEFLEKKEIFQYDLNVSDSVQMVYDDLVRYLANRGNLGHP